MATAAGTLLVAACASAPTQQGSVTGTIPAGRPYRVVGSAKDAPPLPALAGLEQCLQSAGMQAGLPPLALVQAAYTVRPAQAQVVPGANDPDRKPPPGGRKRDREVLTLTITDSTAGTELLRASVARLLGKGETPGDGTALVAPLCAALTAPAADRPAAASR